MPSTGGHGITVTGVGLHLSSIEIFTMEIRAILEQVRFRVAFRMQSTEDFHIANLINPVGTSKYYKMVKMHERSTKGRNKAATVKASFE